MPFEYRFIHAYNSKRSIRLTVAHYNRARRAGVPVEVIDLGRLFHESGGFCGICHKPISFEDFTLDHIRPISKGGAHIKRNVQIAHRACNSAKGNRELT